MAAGRGQSFKPGLVKDLIKFKVNKLCIRDFEITYIGLSESDFKQPTSDCVLYFEFFAYIIFKL